LLRLVRLTKRLLGSEPGKAKVLLVLSNDNEVFPPPRWTS
jgi:hypothetical protein